MSLRSTAGLLFAAAALLYLALALPLGGRSAALAEEYQLLQVDRRRVEDKNASLERREMARVRAMGAADALSSDERDAASLLRLSVVESLRGAGVSGVRLSVRPGRPPVGAMLSLAAEGGLADVLGLSTRLARPGGAAVLSRVRFVPKERVVAMDLDGLSLRGRR